MKHFYLNNNIFNEARDVSRVAVKVGGDDDYYDVLNAVAEQELDRADYDSADEYQEDLNDFWLDGTEQLWFIPRNSVLCGALFAYFNYLVPNQDVITVGDFDKVAAKYINGFVSRLTDDDVNKEGFYFCSSCSEPISDDLLANTVKGAAIDKGTVGTHRFLKWLNN